MNNRQKTKKLLELFLSQKDVEGVCGYIIDDEFNEDDERLAVYVLIDQDYLMAANTIPSYISRMIKGGVEKEIKKWLDLDVYVGSIVKKCNETIKESKKKYIVTESQYNLILESQKHRQVFEDLIQNEIKHIQKECEDGTVDYPDYPDDEHCKQLEDLEKIVVTDADWITIMHSNQPLEQKYMSIKLMVYYSSIRRGDFDADDIAYELERRLRLSTGMPLIINYESTNTNTNLVGNMKYIITESQLKMIQEDSMPMWMRRRLNVGELNNYLQKAVEGEDPTNYSDEFEYADNMISFAVNDFMSIDEEYFETDESDEWTERLSEMMRDEFGDELFQIWRSSNPDEDELFDDDEDED